MDTSCFVGFGRLLGFGCFLFVCGVMVWFDCVVGLLCFEVGAGLCWHVGCLNCFAVLFWFVGC